MPALEGLRVSSARADRPRCATPAPGAPAAPEPTARRQFAPSGTLHCRFEVYGAATDAASGKPSVTAGFSVRRSDGRFLGGDAGDAAPAAARTARSPRRLGIPLDGAPPGRYEAIVVVTDLAAGRSAEAREPFVIEAPRSRSPLSRRSAQLGERPRDVRLLRVEAQRLAEGRAAPGRSPTAIRVRREAVERHRVALPGVERPLEEGQRLGRVARSRRALPRGRAAPRRSSARARSPGGRGRSPRPAAPSACGRRRAWSCAPASAGSISRMRA